MDLRARWKAPKLWSGPPFHPPHGPCYMCYRMRAVACAGNPEEAFAVERHLDRRKTDLSHKREGLVFGAGIAGNMAGLEVVKMLTGASQPSLVGRLLTVSLQDLRIAKAYGAEEADGARPA